MILALYPHMMHVGSNACLKRCVKQFTIKNIDTFHRSLQANISISIAAEEKLVTQGGVFHLQYISDCREFSVSFLYYATLSKTCNGQHSGLITEIVPLLSSSVLCEVSKVIRKSKNN